MYSNTILKLDLIIIIIQKYCFKYLKPDKNIDKIKKSKTIQFVLDQLNDIRKTKDFKVLKSIFTIEKKYKIKDLKHWLNTLCANNFKLFSKHFKLDVEIDMTKGYRTYVNLLSRLGNNKTKVDLKESNKKISILFNLLFCNIIVGGSPGKAEKKKNTDRIHPYERLQSKISNLIKAMRVAKERKDLLTDNIIKKHYKSPTKSDVIWGILYNLFKEPENRDSFLKLQSKHHNERLVPDPQQMTRILQLSVEDLKKKNEYFSNWEKFFAKVEKSHLEECISKFRQIIDDKSNTQEQFKDLKANLETKFNKNPDHKLIVCFALLLNLWTSAGDEWIKQETDMFDTLFTDFLTIVLLPELNNRSVIKSYSDNSINYNHIVDATRNPREKYVCALSLLTAIFYDSIEFNDTILLYFGTDIKVINILQSEKIQHIKPQSATYDIETADNFTKDAFGIFPVSKDLNSPFTAVAINSISQHKYEGEALFIPKRPLNVSNEDKEFLSKEKTVKIHIKNLKRSVQDGDNGYKQILDKITNFSNDLLELQSKNVTLYFFNSTSVNPTDTLARLLTLKLFDTDDFDFDFDLSSLGDLDHLFDIK